MKLPLLFFTMLFAIPAAKAQQFNCTYANDQVVSASQSSFCGTGSTMINLTSSKPE